MTIEDRVFDGTRVVLDEKDADTLLRALYNGKKPARVHTLVCLCGATADLRKSPKAWNGWRVLPTSICPGCMERLGPQRREEDVFPHEEEMRAEFLAEIRLRNAILEES